MVFLGAAVDAPAKLNVSLRILGRRSDGYHLLDSVAVPITLFDFLHVEVSPAEAAEVSVVSNRSDLAGAHNLAYRAAALFLKKAGVCCRVAVTLDKRIPIGAGLGGGSSDAAAVLLALDRLVGTRLGREQLLDWAEELGADVPFFVCGRPARMRGIGEIVEPLPACPSWAVVVAFSGKALSTARVYEAYDRALTNRQPASNTNELLRGWAPPEEVFANDLEPVAIDIQPELRSLKQRLLDLGALQALMTGSGSAMFGVWQRFAEAQAVAERMRSEGTWACAATILDRSPKITEEIGKEQWAVAKR